MLVTTKEVNEFLLTLDSLQQQYRSTIDSKRREKQTKKISAAQARAQQALQHSEELIRYIDSQRGTF